MHSIAPQETRQKKCQNSQQPELWMQQETVNQEFKSIFSSDAVSYGFE